MKMLMGFTFTRIDGGTSIETRTLVVATDESNRRKFGRYWLVIRAASGLIRRAMLRAVARQLAV
ncbi:MAG TPA: hypothetical protein VHU91_03465 [Mycobacteriales bacterium]|nr:hypothetical protein [Mycobacteriales bacterium]